MRTWWTVTDSDPTACRVDVSRPSCPQRLSPQTYTLREGERERE